MLDALLERLEKEGIAVMDVSLKQLQLQHPNRDKEILISLKNLYKVITESPKEMHDKLLNHFVSQIKVHVSPKPSKQLIFPRLLPQIHEKTRDTPWFETLIPNLLELSLVIEIGDSLRFMHPMDIVRSGKSLEELKSEAMENLHRVSRHLMPQKDEYDILRFEIGDGYDASRFLMLKYWFPNRAVWVAMPSRDSLWILRGEPAIEHHKILEEAYQDLPYPLLGVWLNL